MPRRSKRPQSVDNVGQKTCATKKRLSRTKQARRKRNKRKWMQWMHVSAHIHIELVQDMLILLDQFPI